MQFALNGVDIGDPVTLVNGIAVGPVLTGLSVGNSTITGTYSGDANYRANSGTRVHPVNMASTTTALTSSANPSVLTTSVTFTATVTPVAPGGGVPGGTVQFKVDGVNRGAPVALDNGVATFTASDLTAGSRSIRADYSGSSAYLSSTRTITQTVSAPTFTMTGPSPSTIQVGGGASTASESNMTVTIGTAFTADTLITLTATATVIGFTNCGDMAPITSVTIPAGATSAAFCAVGLRAGTATATAALPAALGGATRTSGIITVNNPTIAVTAGPTPTTIDVNGSSAPDTSTITVSITPAQPGDIALILTESGLAGADFVECGTTTAINSITLPGGASSVSFCVRALSSGTTFIQARLPAALGSGATTPVLLTVVQ
jgi:hypothetical protein